MMIPKKPFCTECGAQFEGEHWHTRCTECYKEQHSITTPARESKIPALVAERNLKPAEPYVVNREHALREIAKAKQAAAYEPDEKGKKKLVSQLRCTHEWSRTDQCEKCEIFLAQILYSVNTPMIRDLKNGVFQ